MNHSTSVSQGTIICQYCDKEIAAVNNTDGVKIWYGICKRCANQEE